MCSMTSRSSYPTVGICLDPANDCFVDGVQQGRCSLMLLLRNQAYNDNSRPASQNVIHFWIVVTTYGHTHDFRFALRLSFIQQKSNSLKSKLKSFISLPLQSKSPHRPHTLLLSLCFIFCGHNIKINGDQDLGHVKGAPMSRAKTYKGVHTFLLFVLSNLSNLFILDKIPNFVYQLKTKML